MLVCHCNGVSDRSIRKAVRKGAVKASEVGMRTGAGTCCGGCMQTVKEIIRSEISRSQDRAPANDIISLPVTRT